MHSGEQRSAGRPTGGLGIGAWHSLHRRAISWIGTVMGVLLLGSPGNSGRREADPLCEVRLREKSDLLMAQGGRREPLPDRDLATLGPALAVTSWPEAPALWRPRTRRPSAEAPSRLEAQREQAPGGREKDPDDGDYRGPSQLGKDRPLGDVWGVGRQTPVLHAGRPDGFDLRPAAPRWMISSIRRRS